MAKPQISSLRKDFRIFGDPGFLVTLLVIGTICAIGAAILVHAANTYGIPIRDYWR
ncbi:hypothetical protein [Microvirga sp. 2TAF3]|uniref:hypothetical protein n=1 Tax=Microvirga sp. 2TAF3 TaxID=3233014 RepID=UPI003F9DE544